LVETTGTNHFYNSAESNIKLATASKPKCKQKADLIKNIVNQLQSFRQLLTNEQQFQCLPWFVLVMSEEAEVVSLDEIDNLSRHDSWSVLTSLWDQQQQHA